jgi:hypothetical protein
MESFSAQLGKDWMEEELEYDHHTASFPRRLSV